MNKPSFLQKFRNNPHNLLLLAGILLLLFPFLPWQINNFADLRIGDTYFVVDFPYFYWFMAVVAALMWGLYIIVKKYLYSSILTRIHALSSATIILLMALELAYNPINLRPRRYITYRDLGYWHNFSAQDLFLIAPIFMLLLVQPVFMINIAGGLIKHKKNHTKS